jgi:hypothetical protein
MGLKTLAPFLSALIISFFIPQAALATQTAASSAVLKNEVLGIKTLDPRVQKLTKFLQSYNSPLTDYAQNFIESADKYQLDWRLIPAITGVESTFGKQIPLDSFNAYGWNNGYFKFKSWEDSIEHVTKVLREKYFDRGLDNPFKIGPVYAPPSKAWAGKVVFFMQKIECSQNSDCLNGFELTI